MGINRLRSDDGQAKLVQLQREKCFAFDRKNFSLSPDFMDGSRVVRIKVDDEELHADVVVGADGYHSIVGEKAGWIREWSPAHCSLGVKEVLDLPSEVINERFQLSDGIGLSWASLAITSTG